MEKRGRPRMESSRTDQYRLRLTTDERAMLEELSIKYNTSIANILRKAIQTQYNMVKSLE